MADPAWGPQEGGPNREEGLHPWAFFDVVKRSQGGLTALETPTHPAS